MRDNFSACEDDWTLITLGSRQVCWKKWGRARGTAARRLCSDWDAVVPLPLSEEENQDFQNALPVVGVLSAFLDITGQIQIDPINRESETVWLRYNGDVPPFTKWANWPLSQPQGSWDWECAYGTSYRQGGVWHPNACDSSYNVVCERPLGTTTSTTTNTTTATTTTTTTLPGNHTKYSFSDSILGFFDDLLLVQH